MKQLLHTPEGVRDIYEEEYSRKLVVTGRIRDVINRYGYKEIQTPSFEFFNIFNQERGSVASREMYKFFDHEGNTLVLRPDMTPSIARCTAKYYTDEPYAIRLSYLGNTFINYHSYQGRLKEFTVQGAELMGDDSSAADAEILALTIECLLSAGLKDFQVDIGQVDFFNGLMEEAGLDEDTVEELRRLISDKNYFGVEDLVLKQNLDPELTKTILKVPELFGSAELIQTAKAMTVNEKSRKAIERLEKLYDILTAYGYADYVSFDLGMLGKFKYYTGIIFQGVTFGTGEPIASGGRYDNLLRQFGKDAPSVGFSISIDGLLTALSRQKVEIETETSGCMIVYDAEKQNTAIRLATYFRKNGRIVPMMKKRPGTGLSEYFAYAKRNRTGDVYYLSAAEAQIQVYAEDGTKGALLALPFGIE